MSELRTAAPPHARFEGSYLGDASRIADTARMECKICWHVYDPAEGCEVWQVSPGTPFTALPSDWRCPVCDGERHQFMTLDGGAAVDGDEVPAPCPSLCCPSTPPAATAAAPVHRLEATFREVHLGHMRGVPIVNEALGVKAVGFRAWDGRWLGMLVTPWFMNLVLLPGDGDDWSGLTAGAKETVEFPSGRYEFVHAHRPEMGGYKACSLFSPMFGFTTMLQATETAAAALAALFDPAIREDGAPTAEIRRRREAELAPPSEKPESEPESEPKATAPLQPSRRALLLGPGAE